MPCRPGKRHLATLIACIVASIGLGGCGSAGDVVFTNVSESWLNVRFFVGRTPNSNELLSKRSFEVRPGETARFKVRRKSSRGTSALVHMQVQAVTPSWDPPGKQYWMELLTQAPVKVVASGKGEKLDFEVGDGELARIPNRQLKKRFNYHIAGAPVEQP